MLRHDPAAFWIVHSQNSETTQGKMANERNVVRLYKEKINLLLDVTQTINEDSTVEELMQEFEILLKEDLQVGKILVFTLADDTWKCILQCNVSDTQREAIDIERDLKKITAIQSLGMDETSSIRGFDAVIPLRHKYHIMGYVLIGDGILGDGVSPTLRNLKFIQALSNLIIVAIENKKMQTKLIKQESLRQELTLASRIQSGLIPPESMLLQTGHTRARSYYHPHDQVGGDYFDIMQLSKRMVGFCIADVSGKGVAAALLMSNFQAMVRALFTAKVSLKELVKELNRRVCQNTKGEKFITLFVGRYDNMTGHLTYVNAGHLPPLLYKRGHVMELVSGSIGLGMLDELPGIDEGDTRVRKGDLLVSYTDGLVEIEDTTGVGSNAEKLMSIMKKGMGIDRTMDEICALAEDTISKGKAFDDTSVMAIEFTRDRVLPF